jgi:hypothetical protein
MKTKGSTPCPMTGVCVLSSTNLIENLRCVRCFPVLITKERFQACPLAAEIEAPHYDLGRLGTDPAKVFRNYRRFRRWVDETLDPAARARGITSCEICHTRLSELPPPEY